MAPATIRPVRRPGGGSAGSASTSPRVSGGLVRSPILQRALEPLDLGGELAGTPGRMSALSTSLTRGETAATASTACLTTAITSSHSPSTLVNIALVSCGQTRLADHPHGRGDGLAHAAGVVGGGGAMEKATSMRPPYWGAAVVPAQHAPRRGRMARVKKYILFDHDGVLVDTELWYYRAGERALADIGCHPGQGPVPAGHEPGTGHVGPSQGGRRRRSRPSAGSARFATRTTRST